MNKKGIFITGTDTGVGKTTIAVNLLKYLNGLGLKTLALKPIATGAKMKNNILYNHDALLLQQHSTLKLPYIHINPFIFKPAIAPNIAARLAEVTLSQDNIYEKCLPALDASFDYLVVEGVGGFMVPINNQQTMADLCSKFNFPLILVIGLKLGCLNRALLTMESILKRNIPCLGWIANSPYKVPMQMKEENISFLKEILPIPFLGQHPNCIWENCL